MPRKRDPRAPKRPPGRPPVYDWETLFNGEEHRLSYGESFTCSPASLRTQVYNAARRRNLRVTFRQVDDVWFSLRAHTGPERIEYDWDRLLDGEVHQLRPGVDFTAKPESFRVYARQVAATRGFTVSIKTLGETLFLQANRPKSSTADLPFEIEES